MWMDWWSQEGTATDFVIEDCAPGQALRFRTAEENMGQRPPLDRTDDALKVVERHGPGPGVFSILSRNWADLNVTAPGCKT